eukprot:TRINITY_DN1885_c0_g1_i1.p1 TRINITY_DN1885_c0_g1~~TRINITY_DN1885_c0_g1_i1.p1  ORF type:complete len:128 (-),score=18.44 TRINITY_DN1885_c0_g1_i1:368-751(-)
MEKHMRSQVDTINQKTQEISNLTTQVANCHTSSQNKTAQSFTGTISTRSDASETVGQTTQTAKGGKTQGGKTLEGDKEGGHEDSLDPLNDTQPETAFETSSATTAQDPSNKEQTSDLEDMQAPLDQS